MSLMTRAEKWDDLSLEDKDFPCDSQMLWERFSQEASSRGLLFVGSTLSCFSPDEIAILYFDHSHIGHPASKQSG
jgi:hypothetical protein